MRHDFKLWQETSTTDVFNGGKILHPVWWDQDPSEAPQGQGYHEQHPGEHPDTVCKMPRNAARKGAMGEAQQDSDMYLLRGDIHLQPSEGNDMQQELRQQACLVPRVAQNVENRVSRLKALGNGQVPIVAAAAWGILNNEDL